LSSSQAVVGKAVHCELGAPKGSDPQHLYPLKSGTSQDSATLSAPSQVTTLLAGEEGGAVAADQNTESLRQEIGRIRDKREKLLRLLELGKMEERLKQQIVDRESKPAR